MAVFGKTLFSDGQDVAISMEHIFIQRKVQTIYLKGDDILHVNLNHFKTYACC